jgi:hypothetical protein
MVGQPNDVVPDGGNVGVGAAIVIEGVGVGVGVGVGAVVGVAGDFAHAPARLAPNTIRMNTRFVGLVIGSRTNMTFAILLTMRRDRTDALPADPRTR